jgi:hypothetical protein
MLQSMLRQAVMGMEEERRGGGVEGERDLEVGRWVEEKGGMWDGWEMMGMVGSGMRTQEEEERVVVPVAKGGGEGRCGGRERGRRIRGWAVLEQEGSVRRQQ